MRKVGIWWTALLTTTTDITGRLKCFSLLFYVLVYLTSPRQHFLCVRVDSWQQQCRVRDCNSTVFWKHHSCLDNDMVVTKWYESRIGAITSICPLTLWNFGKVEQMRLEVGIISTMQVLKWFYPLWWKTSQLLLLEKNALYSGCLVPGI